MGFEKKEKRFAVERQQELERMPADESKEDDRAHDDLEQQNEMRYQGLMKQIRQHLPLMGWNSSDCIR